MFRAIRRIAAGSQCRAAAGGIPGKTVADPAVRDEAGILRVIVG